MTSPYHTEVCFFEVHSGSKISASQQSFLIFALSNDGRKVWSTVLFHHVHESHTRSFLHFVQTVFFYTLALSGTVFTSWVAPPKMFYNWYRI